MVYAIFGMNKRVYVGQSRTDYRKTLAFSKMLGLKIRLYTHGPSSKDRWRKETEVADRLSAQGWRIVTKNTTKTLRKNMKSVRSNVTPEGLQRAKKKMLALSRTPRWRAHLKKIQKLATAARRTPKGRAQMRRNALARYGKYV